MLKLKNTPGFAGDNLVMTHPQHKQIRQYRNANRFLTTILVPADLVLAQPQARFQLPVHQLDRPAFLVHTHHLSRRQFGQIGHQEFRVVGAGVTPFFAQDQGDITDMTQTHTRMICPEGPATFACTLSGDLGALIIDVRQMRHEILQRFLFDGFPRASDGKDKAPPACRIGSSPGPLFRILL